MSQTTDDLNLPEQGAGLLFRAEMAAQNAILGYWKVLVGIIVAILVGILLYSQYDSWYKGRQAAWASEIARVEFAARDAMQSAAADPSLLSDEDEAALRAAADELSAIAAEATGPAAAEGWMKAAEVYRVIGETASQRTALESAVPHARAAVSFAARAALAALLVDEGDVDGSVARWSELSTEFDGYLGAWATLNLARTLAAFDRTDAARAAYDDLLVRFPDTELTATATDERAGLAAAARVAPSPAAVAPTPPEPADGDDAVDPGDAAP